MCAACNVSHQLETGIASRRVTASQANEKIHNMSEQRTIAELLLELWRHIQPKRRTQLAGIGGLMLASTFAEIASIAAILPFLGAVSAPEKIFSSPWAAPLIQTLGLTEPVQLLFPLTMLFVAAALTSGATRVALLWGQTRLSFEIGADLGMEVYRRTLYQPYSVHVMRNSSQVISGIMNKAGSLVFIAILPVQNLISAVIILVSVMALLIAIEPMIAVSTFMGFGAIYAVIFLVTKKHLIRAGQRVTQGQDNVLKALQEGLGGIRDVLIDGTQEAYCRIFRDVDVPLRRASANTAIIGGAPRFVIEAVSLVLIGVMAYIMAGRPGGMETAVPILGALALGGQRILPLLQQMYHSLTSLRGGKALLQDALELLAQPLPSQSLIGEVLPIPFRKSIALSRLKFRYGTDSPWVIEGIDLEIARGSRIGLIGKTGSGKSTLLDILMGLLTPTQGSIFVDGVEINEINQQAWRARIAHVPQSIYLADTSIAENIAFGIRREVIDHHRLRHAAERAQVAETIESWEKGYDTFVGERGIRLSGGQRQRIGIARALYKNADVIILDEATSALDGDTEETVMGAINGLAKDLTIVMVAHRLTTLKSCDQIIELSDGTIRRIFTYPQLVES